MSFLVRVFKPPTKSSGQLLEADATVAENIEGGFLVEFRLQEGDRLHFSSLFRDMLLNFTKVRPINCSACNSYISVTGSQIVKSLLISYNCMKSLTAFRTDSAGMWHDIMTITSPSLSICHRPDAIEGIVWAILDPIPGTRNGQNKSPLSASRLPCLCSAFVL